MPRRPSGPVEEASPLRRARLARNLTLEDVVEEIDLRTPGGHSGVTPSMVSGWELGRHTTSIGHRKTLCEIYEQPPDVLFAHQDRGLAAGAGLRLVAGFQELQQAMLSTGLAPAAKVAGPSNIGNYLAGLGIPATAGFGVDYRDLHGTDERIRLDSIPVVQAAYHQALLTLLHAT
jgi:transcriptional regulator with XRE-family HTH domain